MATLLKFSAGDGSDPRYFAERQPNGTFALRVPDPWSGTQLASTAADQDAAITIIDGALAQAKLRLDEEAAQRTAHRNLLAQYGFK